MRQEENKTKNRLLLRAKILTKIRTFFAKRNVIEVETPRRQGRHGGGKTIAGG